MMRLDRGKSLAAMALSMAGLLAPLLAGCASPGRAEFTPAQVTWDDFAGRRAGPEAGAAFELPDEPELADLLTFAALHNDGLRAAFHRWRAAAARVDQAGAWPDPKFTYAYYFLEVETRVGPQRQSFSLAQGLPWPAELAAAEDAASQLALAEWRRFQAAKLELFERVRAAAAESHYLAGAVEVAGENLDLLGQLERVVRSRYEAGAASHPDLLRLQVEIGKLEDRLAGLRQRARPVAARLNAALGRPASREPPRLKNLPPAADPPERVRLLARLDEANPELAALTAEAAAAEHRIEQARLGYLPDLGLAATFIDTRDRVDARPADNGNDALMGMVTASIPLWRKKLDAAVREARQRRMAIAARRRQARRDLETDLDEALYHLRDARRKADLYGRTLLPKARESLRVTQTAYSAGRQTFTDLIEAQQVLLEFELARRRAEADRLRWLGTLERLIGGPLSRSEPGPSPATRPAGEAAGR
jgi:outer membrane protein TolC